MPTPPTERASFDGGLRHYVATVRRVPKLERDEELELFRRWQVKGDARAKSKLLLAHLRAVIAIALKYRHYDVPLDELVSEGNLGLVHALTKFDPDRGTRFMTYASFWIRAYVLDHVLASFSLVGGGSGALRSKLFFKLRRERARVLALVGDGEQADRLLAERLGLRLEAVQGMLRRLDGRDLSLDAAVSNDGSGPAWIETLPNSQPNHDELLERREHELSSRRACERALGMLDARERFIVEERLMAERGDERSLTDLGRTLGVSRERARQLEARAKQKLRRNLAAHVAEHAELSSVA